VCVCVGGGGGGGITEDMEMEYIFIVDWTLSFQPIGWVFFGFLEIWG